MDRPYPTYSEHCWIQFFSWVFEHWALALGGFVLLIVVCSVIARLTQNRK